MRRKKRKRDGVSVPDAGCSEEVDEIITLGLALKLESVRRKNPYFKRSRRRSDANRRSMTMTREEKLSAMSFARRIVKAYFRVTREHPGFVSPN